MKRGRWKLGVLGLVFAPLAGSTRAEAVDSCGSVDLVLRGGHIVTLDDAGRIAQAMAVRDRRIVLVGTDGEVAPCIGAKTKTLDLQGKTVLPGLVDVHTHAMDWAKSILRDEIDATSGVRSVGDVVDQVRRRTAAAPPGRWVVGFGWDDSKLAENRYLTRHDLDPVSHDHPVYLAHVSGHLAVANSLALRLSGIGRESRDPEGGVIERDAALEPTGILKDNAMPLVARLLPPDPPDLAERGADLVSRKAVDVGLTTLHDIGVSPGDLRGYQRSYQRGELKVRVHLSPGVSNVEETRALAARGLATGFGDDRLKLGAVKLFADGGMGARTVAIYDPPVAAEPGNHGLLIWKSEDLQEAHRILAEAGWQIVTHAIGDRAIDQVLDSYQAAVRTLGLKDHRFRIAHCGISTPAVLKRLRELEVVVDGNPAFVYWIGSWFLKYGPERVRWSYPGKSYIDYGIVAGAGSDVSVTPMSPWWGIWAAVVRREIQTGEVLAPEERLEVSQALRLYTGNGAYIGFEEKDKGSLEPHKLADFIVVDRDVLSVPEDQLKDVRVLMTFVGGERVYERE